MKPAVLHPAARDDLDGAIAYYEGQREGLGIDLQREVEAGLYRIRQHPEGYPLIGTTGVRRHEIRRFPYSIFYAELEDWIWVAAVAHHKRRPRYWVRRKPE
jgi:toxin ParE1/3/4